MHVRISTLLLCLLATAGTASARPVVDVDGLRRLERYDVVTYTDPAGAGLNKNKAIGVFDASPEEIFRTATDYNRLSEFAPRVVSSRVVDDKGDGRAVVLLTSDLPWPVSNAWAYTTFQREKLDGGVYRIRFWQVRGSLKRYFGSILIEPWGEPWGEQKSAVTYEVVAEPDSIAPKRVLNTKMRDAASQYVHALRQRINDLHRLGRLHPEQPPTPNLASPLVGQRPIVVKEVAAAHR